MFSFLTAFSASSPTPMPRELDPATVNPGPISGIVFTLLLISLVVLMFSMNRHLKRIKINRDDESK